MQATPPPSTRPVQARAPAAATPSAGAPPRRGWPGRLLLLALALSALAGIGGWLRLRQPVARQRVYTGQGYGGFVAASNPRMKTTPAVAADPLRSVEAAYQAGQYAQAEAGALRIVEQSQTKPSLQPRPQALRARRLLAYAAARKNDFSLARERFAALQAAAGALPSVPGERRATLQEEGAFQHAVCTGALGDKAGAEAEYRAFLCRYPDSILIHAAVKRIARYHGGDLPKQADALWQQAMQGQARKEKARQREDSLCGPQCLAELLRRQGKQPDVHALADEMQTSDEGTSLLALAQAARKRGYRAQGVQLTAQGLTRQKLPLIALLQRGHYVLVERVTPAQVRVWDPDVQRRSQAGRTQYPCAQWQQVWSGIALTLQ